LNGRDRKAMPFRKNQAIIYILQSFSLFAARTARKPADFPDFNKPFACDEKASGFFR
jgi:hypothetical protein